MLRRGTNSCYNEDAASHLNQKVSGYRFQNYWNMHMTNLTLTVRIYKGPCPTIFTVTPISEKKLDSQGKYLPFNCSVSEFFPAAWPTSQFLY
mmetsp:Transcript_4021/g.25273  ORF Transcript_4021/g.25273 Transcript_4021/m.25273 type:complete len:92 (+) Transcript_4021:934-1209(+)